MANYYIDFIKNQNQKQNSSSKNFYIIISSDNVYQKEEQFDISRIRDYLNSCYIKINDSLSKCGNIVIEQNSKKEVEKILFSFYNFRKKLKFI